LHAQRVKRKFHGRNAFCWVYFNVNDNKKWCIVFFVTIIMSMYLVLTYAKKGFNFIL
jgi:hypothetical protein